MFISQLVLIAVTQRYITIPVLYGHEKSANELHNCFLIYKALHQRNSLARVSTQPLPHPTACVTYRHVFRKLKPKPRHTGLTFHSHVALGPQGCSGYNVHGSALHLLWFPCVWSQKICAWISQKAPNINMEVVKWLGHSPLGQCWWLLLLQYHEGKGNFIFNSNCTTSGPYLPAHSKLQQGAVHRATEIS